ncbi:hypothetical protein CANARDRAFT_179447, partial [[Candida] arabinofermentans NRRL YB-2248]
FEVRVGISVIECVDRALSSDWIKKFKEFAEFVMEIELNSYQRGLVDGLDDMNESGVPSESNFYDLVTENTRLYHYDENGEGLERPDLNKTLLGFQKQTLQWMLGHEGMKLNESAQAIPKDGYLLEEGESLESTKNLEIIARNLDQLVFGWSLAKIPNTTMKLWFNKYTGNICSTSTAVEYLQELAKSHSHRAKALLSEEMGLGKTVEVISLITVNPRPANELTITKPDYFNGGRIIPQSKTTLIICPQSILGQWQDEIAESNPSLKFMVYEGIYNYEKGSEDSNTSTTAADMAKKLAEHDIVLVSYSTVSRELHRALFKPSHRTQRKRVENRKIIMFNGEPMLVKPGDYLYPEESGDEEENRAKLEKMMGGIYQKVDYSSPLMLLEFWRVVLDEQINLPKQTRILLKMPFSVIERDNYDNLFANFLRQVGLNEKGEPVVDDYDPARSYTYMRQWLVKLRQICCHAHLGSTGASRRRNDTFFLGNEGSSANADLIIGTLDDVLESLKKATHDETLNSDRVIVQLTLKKGKIYEFLRDPVQSLKVYEQILPEVERHLKEQSDQKSKDEQELTLNQARKKSWLELLYQTYFLIASAHYQHYKPMRPMPLTFDSEGNIPDESTEEDKPVEIDPTILTPEERVHYDAENIYYKKADELLTQILEEPINKSNEAISKMNEKFESFERYVLLDPQTSSVKLEKSQVQKIFVKEFEVLTNECDLMIDDEGFLNVCTLSTLLDIFQENYGHSSQVRQYYDKLWRVIKKIELQSHVINYWISKLLKLLKVPVTTNADDATDDQMNTGEEYSENLQNQSLVHTYLTQLQLMLEDRENGLLRVELLTQRKKNKRSAAKKVEMDTLTTSDLYKRLDSIRKMVMPDGVETPELSLRNLLVDSQELKNNCEHHDRSDSSAYSSDYDFMTSLSDHLKKEFELQRKNTSHIRTKLFELLNETFNSKISYFKSLQIKSDTVANYQPIHQALNAATVTPSEVAEKDMRSTTLAIARLEDTSRKSRVRLTYLNSLMNEEAETSGVDDDEETEKHAGREKVCVICRCSIIVGTLTSCGHQYCKDCLAEWTKNNPSCPLCKKVLTKADIYTFTLTRNELKGALVEDTGEDQVKEEEGQESEVDDVVKDDDINDDMHKIYKSMSEDVLKEITEIQIRNNYGAKIDMIIRQVLYLKRNERSVQILIFSQWSEFLTPLGRALRQNNIQYLSSAESSSITRLNEEGASRRSRSKKSAVADTNNIDIFKKNPEITCFLLNAKAQAAGLTLTNASHVFLCEPLVNLPLELQAISRVHRIGQSKETKVWNFVIENSVEESIAFLSTKKRLELVRSKNRVRDRSATAEVDDDEVDSTELSKPLSALVDKSHGGGEVVSNDDLWASFFASKSASVMDSVVS